MKGSIENIIIKYFSGEINKEDAEKLNEWINTSEKNKKEFIVLKDLWDASSEETERDRIKSIIGWDKIKNGIHKKPKPNIRFTPAFFFKTAASIVLLVSISYLLTLIAPWDGNNKLVINQISVPKGSKTHLELNDGTKIWLNADSKLNYAENTGRKDRKVYLEGEAFFDVAENPERPFIVKTSEIDIKVLGTTFNVKSYPGEKTIETTLIKGLVEIKNVHANNPDKMVLHPNQKATYYKKRKIKNGSINEKKYRHSHDMPGMFHLEKTADIELNTAWKDQKLVFKNENFQDLSVRLERWYKVNIIIKSAEVKKYTFTGIFENETIEQALKALQLTAPFKYAINQNKITITVMNEH